MTPDGIEKATFRFVAQHLNHCTTAVPVCMSVFGFYNDESQYTRRPIIIILRNSGVILCAILFYFIACCIILTFCFLWHKKLSCFCVFQIVQTHTRALAINMQVEVGLRQSHWPRGLRCGSEAARLLGTGGFESRRGHGGLSRVSVVCCQVEVST